MQKLKPRTESTIDSILIDTITISSIHSEFYEKWETIRQKFGKRLSGIYFLQRFDYGKIAPISRLIGTDSKGILYIGKSDNLTSRLGILVNLLNGTSTTGKHSMGLRYQEIEAFREHLKPENMKLSVKFCENPRNLESELLKQYLHRHGELPPLNNSK